MQWVIVVLILTANGGTRQEVVAGDYFTKADCKATIQVLPNDIGKLQCVKRRPGMKNHEAYFIGD